SSSRRRHTRSKRDWSSDVCSSDLRVDPHLDADAAERRTCLEEAVVDVGAQRVQRDPPLAVELRAGHLCPTQAATTLDPDALGAALDGTLHRLAHRPAEGHTAAQLLGHALGDELRIDLRGLDLEDVELNLLAGQLLQVGADAVGLHTTTTDDDARSRCVDVHTDA